MLIKSISFFWFKKKLIFLIVWWNRSEIGKFNVVCLNDKFYWKLNVFYCMIGNFVMCIENGNKVEIWLKIYEG